MDSRGPTRFGTAINRFMTPMGVAASCASAARPNRRRFRQITDHT